LRTIDVIRFLLAIFALLSPLSAHAANDVSLTSDMFVERLLPQPGGDAPVRNTEHLGFKVELVADPAARVAELLAQQLNRPKDVAAHEQLSEREFQDFLKLAKGETAGDIAKALSLSVETVSTYRTRVMEKMSLASNSDLTYYALKNKLID